MSTSRSRIGRRWWPVGSGTRSGGSNPGREPGRRFGHNSPRFVRSARAGSPCSPRNPEVACERATTFLRFAHHAFLRGGSRLAPHARGMRINHEDDDVETPERTDLDRRVSRHADAHHPRTRCTAALVQAGVAGAAADVEKASGRLGSQVANKDVDATVVSESPVHDTRTQLLGFMNTYSIRLYRITAITVKGDTATIDYENTIVGRNLKADATTTLLGQRDVWTKTGGVWKSVSDVASSPGIPRKSHRVGDGHAARSPTDGDRWPAEHRLRFLVKNTGVASKGVFILGIPADLNVRRRCCR